MTLAKSSELSFALINIRIGGGCARGSGELDTYGVCYVGVGIGGEKLNYSKVFWFSTTFAIQKDL